MNNKIKFSLTVGDIYEVRGKGKEVVRSKFVHANSGKPTVEIDGVQKEVDSILGLIEPEEFQGLFAVDAPIKF